MGWNAGVRIGYPKNWHLVSILLLMGANAHTSQVINQSSFIIEENALIAEILLDVHSKTHHSIQNPLKNQNLEKSSVKISTNRLCSRLYALFFLNIPDLYHWTNKLNLTKTWKWETTPKANKTCIKIFPNLKKYYLKKQLNINHLETSPVSRSKTVKSRSAGSGVCEVGELLLWRIPNKSLLSKSLESAKVSWFRIYPPWKLTFSPLKMDGWKTIVSFWVERPIFRDELLVSGSVGFRVGQKH